MSKSRAKKKQRQRARAPSSPNAPSALQPAAPRKEAAPAASRLDVRDGVARPRPIWAPFPLTEIGMVAGIVIFTIGFESDASRSTSLMTIGAIVLAVVVGELCLREHLAGFRSHTLLLAALPVASAHGIVFLAITHAYAGPLALAVDLAIGGALAWWLRERYRVARERALDGPAHAEHRYEKSR